MTYDEIMQYFKFYKYNEEVFLESEKYLYIDVKNKDAYSFCFSNLLINICSDFESLSKKYYGLTKDKTITDIIISISSDNDFSTFFSEKITLLGTSYKEIEPLRNDGSTFSWWTKYNSIKHDKLQNIYVATQESVVNALSALYALNMYILKSIANRESKPDIFLNYTPRFELTNLKNKTHALNEAYFETEE